MFLFHGTTRRAADSIEREGFRGSKAVDLHNKQDMDGAYVFFSDNFEHANAYGEVIIKVWLPDDVELIRWEGYGPFGDDEIIVSEEILFEEGIIEEIVESEMPEVI